MKVISSLSEMRDWSLRRHSEQKTIGLVPTMGYLHEGHLSLIRLANEMCDEVVVSIFVNPVQFAPDEDLDNYPSDFRRDEQLCRKENVSCIFYPSQDKMYPASYDTYIVSEKLARLLCGRSRPIHFKGVKTVVLKLFNIVKADVAVFGQKDAQQSIIIQRMVEDLNLDIKIVIAPTIRETDGLAMSSRNKYLNPKHRAEATILYKSLLWAKAEIESDNLDIKSIKRTMHKMIEENSEGNIDYIEIVNSTDLTGDIYDNSHILIAVAVYFGKARLIDNVVILRKGDRL